MGEIPVPGGWPGPPAKSGEPPPPRTHHDVLHGWEVPLDRVDVDKMRAKEHLAAEVRRLVEAVALLDGGEVAQTVIEEFTEELRVAADRLSDMPSLLAYGSPAIGPPVASALDQRSPVSGQSNPIAPPMLVDFDGERAYASAVYGPAYEGPPFHVHGGWVIAAFDELLGVAQAASSQPGMTGTITIRLRRPTPIGKRIDYEGWVERAEGRKTICRGEACLDGEVLAEAEAVFIAPRNWVAGG